MSDLEGRWAFNFPTNIQKELDDIDERLDGSVWTTFIRAYIQELEADNARLREANRLLMDMYGPLHTETATPPTDAG